MEFKVVKINHEFKNVVVSHKALIEADIELQKKDIISKLEKGQVLEGTVKKIGSDALPPSQSEQRAEYKYPATIELKEQIFKLKNGSTLPLQVGMSLSANIKLRKVSYLQLLFTNLETKTEALKRF